MVPGIEQVCAASARSWETTLVKKGSGFPPARGPTARTDNPQGRSWADSPLCGLHAPCPPQIHALDLRAHVPFPSPSPAFGSFLCLIREFFPSPLPGTDLISAPLSYTARRYQPQPGNSRAPGQSRHLSPTWAWTVPSSPPGQERVTATQREVLDPSRGLASSWHLPDLWGPCKGASPREGREHTNTHT